MTEKELAVIVQALAPIVREHADRTASEALTRVAVLEAQLKSLGDVRDRVIVMETKSSLQMPTVDVAPVDLAPVLMRMQAHEADIESIRSIVSTHDVIAQRIYDARERVAALEARPQLPGPQGEPGQPGKDGLDGKDGSAGLSFEGVYQEGKSYEPGQLATYGGSSWHCNEQTTTKPGEGSKAWTLMVKRGRDGKDGRDAQSIPVVSVGAR